MISQDRHAAAPAHAPPPAALFGERIDGGGPDAGILAMDALIVEDDPDIGRLLSRGLAAEGCRVVLAASGEEAIEAACLKPFDAVILDVMLPGASGLEVCRSLRRSGLAAAIIMLSARSAVSERLAGLAAGADDYIVKPFEFAELVARLSVHRIRRCTPANAGRRLAAGAITLDLDVRIARWHGRETNLTEREAELLALLMRNCGRPLSRNQIFETMWANHGGTAMNIVDVYIGYLRRKLGGGADALIRTIHGRGFMLCGE
jgi:DNA-binding response OmpR family regulator